ncbi:hypothetical protein [Rufibacter hautae]|uniref:Uncharacterized protein n=1 Tax=Rufibacter hautae TaxID=2595005 RepID=A0A5B6TIG4_9BACT|nr:hypothetical protein [Rufibacter hautae]KAA3440452.1 hypothetical protein FOA19_07310 [Rufibacter hautae]
MKRILLTILIIVGISFASFAQRGTYTYNVDPDTKQVSNFITRYYFTHVYSEKFNSDQSLRTDRAKINIYIQVLSDGTGKLVEDINGNQTEFLVSSCFKHEDHYKFEMTNSEGIAWVGTLFLKNKNIEKFSRESASDITVFFLPNSIHVK